MQEKSTKVSQIHRYTMTLTVHGRINNFLGDVWDVSQHDCPYNSFFSQNLV